LAILSGQRKKLEDHHGVVIRFAYACDHDVPGRREGRYAVQAGGA
jgi:hypothetical protein